MMLAARESGYMGQRKARFLLAFLILNVFGQSLFDADPASLARLIRPFVSAYKSLGRP